MSSSTVARAATRRILATACATMLIAGCSSDGTASEPVDPALADSVTAVVEDTMAEAHLRAAVVKVTIDGEPVLSRAFGQSMTGVPASTDMHFRNGAVAISYVATLLLILVDEGQVRLDHKLSTWLPDFPHSDQVTLGQLAQMTSGYPDYVLGNDEFVEASYADPFRQWSTDELLALVADRPLLYPPGTNWNYAHTNYVLLGLALEKATGQDMPSLLREKVLTPLGLDNTANADTAAIPAPVLHAFSSERREFLDVAADVPFYEESTFWNPSWTITHGAIQTTTIDDLATSAQGIGSGQLLSEGSHEAMVATSLRGKTRSQPGCPTCHEMTESYTYGIGIVISGDWLLQNPLFSGCAAVGAYLPTRQIAIAVAVTYEEAAFDDEGNYPNAADTLFRKIGAVLAPDEAPPQRTAK